MNILAISVNHRTASVEQREAVFLSEDEITKLIESLKSNLFSEGLVLSTCNRTEIYGTPINPRLTHQQIIDSVRKVKAADKLTEDNFQSFISRDAVRQLFRVVSGLDSMLIGDNQIFKQVKDSFQMSEANRFAGFKMKRIFDSTIRTGKRAITETHISDGAVTVSYAAVQLIEKIFSSLHKKSALVIGAGETGELAAKHLMDKNIGKLTVTNRTAERAEELAKKLGAGVILFPDFKESLYKYDIILSATSSPDILINSTDVNLALKKRNYESMVLMDIAIPRDIDVDTKKLDNVFYHDIDSLNIIVEQNLRKRKAEIPKVEKIIEEELGSFFEWYNSLQAAPTIKDLRDLFEDIRKEEVEKNINRFTSEDREKLDIVTKRIINKILHNPTVELKKMDGLDSADNETTTRLGIIRELFSIDKKKDNENN